jgi:hypothetical protein
VKLLTYKGNRYSDGLNYSIMRGTVKGFMKSHNKKQRLYMHALLHSPSAEEIPEEKRVELHNAIVRQDLKGGMQQHKTPI